MKDIILKVALFTIVLGAILLIACKKKEETLNTQATSDFPVAITNQSGGRIQVFDPQASDWSDVSSLVWSWYPNESNGFSANTAGWGAPSDVKLRFSDYFGGQVMAVADSRGFCALIPYPAGDTKYWATNVGGPGPGLNNPHAIELLPNGNVAVAASNGNYVRVYTSSQGEASTKYTEFTLRDAHGVLWDPSENLLWALGGDELTALEIGGTDAEPVISEITSFRIKLPTISGHDLTAYYGDTNKLLLTTEYGVYTFDKTTKTFTELDGLASGRSVKSVGNQPSGQLVQARPSPSTCADPWNTNTVFFYNPNLTKTTAGACFYKARVWWDEYQ